MTPGSILLAYFAGVVSVVVLEILKLQSLLDPLRGWLTSLLSFG